MKLISKEFFREKDGQLIIDQLLATVELDNKQYCIVIDNSDNFTEEKYCFGTSKYQNDDVDRDIIKQFKDSEFYYELCKFAKSKAQSLDDELENDIEKELEKNYHCYKKDRNYYNSEKLTIFKHNKEDSFILRVENIKNHCKRQSFYNIDSSDFDKDCNEVELNDWYEFDSTNEILEI